MTESTRLWIEAAKVLGVNPDAKVTCPICKTGTLTVKDKSFSADKIDRYMICDSCGKHNVITLITKTFIDEINEEDEESSIEQASLLPWVTFNFFLN